MELQPVGNSIDGGAQIQQIVKVDVLDIFNEFPTIELSFM